MSEHTAFSVRHATASDRAAVEALLNSAALPLAGVAEMFEEDASQFVVASADSDPTQLVAAAAIEVRDEVAMLRSVVVRNDMRGHGFGERMVSRAIDEANVRGLHALYLLTTTAASFFPRFGFAIVDRATIPTSITSTVEFQSACPASATAMAKHLNPVRVLILCTRNSARSQIAEALFLHEGKGRVLSGSAGSDPGPGVHQLAVEALAEIGIDWTNRTARGIDDVADGVAGAPWDAVITVCDPARDACPVMRGASHAAQMSHWGFSDPAAATGTHAEQLGAFRQTREDLHEAVRMFMAQLVSDQAGKSADIQAGATATTGSADRHEPHAETSHTLRRALDAGEAVAHARSTLRA